MDEGYAKNGSRKLEQEVCSRRSENCAEIVSYPPDPLEHMGDKRKQYIQAAVAICAELGKGKAFGVADTGSMYPLLDHTCRIYMTYTSLDDIDIGDIVVFHTHSGHLVAHRVLQKCEREGKSLMLQRGDWGIGLPSAIWAHQVVGRVVLVDQSNGGTLDLTTRRARTLYGVFARICLFTYGLPVVRRSILHNIWRGTEARLEGPGNRAKHWLAKGITYTESKFRYGMSWMIMELLGRERKP